MVIEAIDEHFQPDYCCTGFAHSYSTLIKVPDYTSEYQICRNRMMGDFVKKFIAIYRVTNKFLEQEYNTKWAVKRSFGFNIRQLELLHCTSKYNVRPIIEDNFDPLRATRIKFGRGVSFSPNPSYANLHSCIDNGIHRAMFLSNVMITKTQVGHPHAIAEPPCDTLVDPSGNVFVKLNDFEFFPTYVMFYISYPVVSQGGQRFLVK